MSLLLEGDLFDIPLVSPYGSIDGVRKLLNNSYSGMVTRDAKGKILGLNTDFDGDRDLSSTIDNYELTLRNPLSEYYNPEA